jgi:glycolate oxidase FAD binding subunit
VSVTPGARADASLDTRRFAVGGREPPRAFRPATREELADALRAAARDRHRIVPWGGGVALGHEPAPERYDLAIDLGGLDRIVEYQPEDFTLTAECGVTIAALRETLAARGQELPLEGAFDTRATLGGVLAANASGPRRLRFGSPRDRILGARFALADGTLARAGGKVVKNVAGYGSHRLLCGSRGGLAIVVEASLKLAPAPAARRALVYHVTAAELARAERWAPFPRLEPAVLSVVGAIAAASLGLDPPASPYAVVVGLEDDAAWMERQRTAVVVEMGPPRQEFEGAAARELWRKLADLEEQDGARLTLTTARNSPAALAALLEGAGRRPGAAEPGARLVFHALAGRLHLFAPAADLRSLAERIAASEFTLIASRGVPDLAPPPTQEAILALRTRLRAAFDPGQVLALGDAWERGPLR